MKSKRANPQKGGPYPAASHRFSQSKIKKRRLSLLLQGLALWPSARLQLRLVWPSLPLQASSHSP
jgi:hypothetical protein